MKKKLLLIICLLICLSVAVYFIYQFVIYRKYNAEKIELNKEAIFNETLTISHEKPMDKLTFEDLVYDDFLHEYTSIDNTPLRIIYGDNGEIISRFDITKEKQYIKLLNANSFSLNSNSNDYVTDKDMDTFLNDNQIKNDIDLINYIKEHYYLENKFFMSPKDMKINYLLNMFVSSTLPSFENIILLRSGEFEGYMFNSRDNIEIHLLHNDEQYIIVMSGEYIANPEFAETELNSMYFK